MTIGELSRRTGMAVRSLRGYASSVYFAGDTDIFPEMSELSAADFPLLPVAGSGPRLPEGEHMSPKRAAEALKVLKPSVAIPIHWGTLAAVGGGGYPSLGFPAADFRGYAREIAPEVEVRVLEPGQAFITPRGCRVGVTWLSGRPNVQGPPGRAGTWTS
jgi:L-ascorbate metabolism protein UlaG (beta-lactamase superfamily)